MMDRLSAAKLSTSVSASSFAAPASSSSAAAYTTGGLEGAVPVSLMPQQQVVTEPEGEMSSENQMAEDPLAQAQKFEGTLSP
jgi:hypothetical protein